MKFRAIASSLLALPLMIGCSSQTPVETVVEAETPVAVELQGEVNTEPSTPSAAEDPSSSYKPALENLAPEIRTALHIDVNDPDDQAIFGPHVAEIGAGWSILDSFDDTYVNRLWVARHIMFDGDEIRSFDDMATEILGLNFVLREWARVPEYTRKEYVDRLAVALGSGEEGKRKILAAITAPDHFPAFYSFPAEDQLFILDRYGQAYNEIQNSSGS